MGSILRFLAARTFPALLGFAALAVYTRLLSREDYGRYSVAIAGVNLVVAALFHWLGQAVVRFGIPAEPERLSYLSTILAIYAGAAAVIALVLVPASLVLGEAPGSMLAIATALVLLESWLLLNQRLAVALAQPARFATLMGCKALCGLIAGAWAAAAGLGAIGVLAGVAFGTAIAGVLPFWTNAWRGLSRARVSRARAAAVFRYGAPLGVTLALGYALAALDRSLLAVHRGAEAAGEYAAAFDLASAAVVFAMSSVNIVAFPRILAAASVDGAAGVGRRMKENLDLLLIAGLPVLVALATVPETLCGTVLGAEFTRAAAGTLPWIAFGAFLGAVRSFYADVVFHVAKDTRAILAIAALVFAVNAAANLVLIPAFGLDGAVAALVLAHAVGLAFSLWRGRASIAAPPDGTSVKVGVAAIAAAAAGVALDDLRGPGALIVQLASIAVVYGVALLALRVGPAVAFVQSLAERWGARREASGRDA
jgi:O-antigen/teichoic acid export membrane protein